MVTEWRELLWDVPEERVALWNHCQALFTMHAFPALRVRLELEYLRIYVVAVFHIVRGLFKARPLDDVHSQNLERYLP